MTKTQALEAIAKLMHALDGLPDDAEIITIRIPSFGNVEIQLDAETEVPEGSELIHTAHQVWTWKAGECEVQVVKRS